MKKSAAALNTVSYRQIAPPKPSLVKRTGYFGYDARLVKGEEKAEEENRKAFCSLQTAARSRFLHLKQRKKKIAILSLTVQNRFLIPDQLQLPSSWTFRRKTLGSGVPSETQADRSII